MINLIKGPRRSLILVVTMCVAEICGMAGYSLWLSIQGLFNPYSIAVMINRGNDPAVNPGHGRLFWKF